MAKIAHCEYEENEFFIEMEYRQEGDRSTIKVTRKLITGGKIDPHYGTESIGHNQIDELPPMVVADYYALHYNGQL